MEGDMLPLWKSLLLAIVAGGAAGASIQVIREMFAEKKKYRIEQLREQQTKLYGPIYFLVQQIQVISQVMQEIDNALDLHYGQKEFSSEPTTQANVERDIKNTIEVKNRYAQILRNNGNRVNDILRDSITYLDSEDVEAVVLFQKNYIRRIVESDDEAEEKLPHRIHFEIGDISLLPSKFIDQVESKFLLKKKELEKLSKRFF